MTVIPPPSEAARRARQWQLRTRTLVFATRPMLMGIVNVTPDSFSDGGQHYDVDTAVEHGIQLARQGADILDVGGESTRPYAEPVDHTEESRRVIPVLQRLHAAVAIPLSVDTSKAAVAAAAMDAGAEIINDISALTSDPAMVEVAFAAGAGVCAMHMQGTPQTMQDAPQYANVVDDVLGYLRDRRDALVNAGIELSRICLDPGIGFGKTHEHNLALLSHIDTFHDLGCPLLVGHSRKGFITKVMGDKQVDPSAGTLGVALALACRGVQVLRVHDVATVRQALLLFEAAGGLSEERGSE